MLKVKEWLSAKSYNKLKESFFAELKKVSKNLYDSERSLYSSYVFLDEETAKEIEKSQDDNVDN